MYHKRYTNRPQALSDAPSDAGGGVGSVGGGGVGGVGVDVAPIGVASIGTSGGGGGGGETFHSIPSFRFIQRPELARVSRFGFNDP